MYESNVDSLNALLESLVELPSSRIVLATMSIANSSRSSTLAIILDKEVESPATKDFDGSSRVLK